MNLLRWAVVPLSGIVVWHAVLLAGILGISLLDRFCPPELIISEACTATWHTPAVEGLVLVCTAIASAGVVIIPAYIAPARRFLVAALAFGCGAVFALYAASDGSLWGAFIVAGLTGSASLWFAASKWRPPRSRHLTVGSHLP